MAQDKLIIADLEIFCRIGVTAEERRQPQRLTLTLELTCDTRAAAASDNLKDTLDYATLSEQLLALGKTREWNLIESLAQDVASLILSHKQVAQVEVLLKKFVIPQARHVAIRILRPDHPPNPDSPRPPHQGL